jgi:hypothetical protein
MSVLVKDSLSKNSGRNLHGINGFVDYRRLREQLGIKSIKLAKAIGKTQRYLHENSQAEGIQRELRKLAYLMVLLKEMLGSREEISIWLNAPNPDYEGLTPLEIITHGKIDSLTRYLEDIQKGSLT